MWQDSYSHGNMMRWDGAWHWLMSFHGLLVLLALTVIIFACVGLYRDWRQEQLDDQGWGKTKHE